MIDLDAPIVPGKSAAGVFIGSVVSELLATVDAHSTTKLSSAVRHDLGTVKGKRQAKLMVDGFEQAESDC